MKELWQRSMERFRRTPEAPQWRRLVEKRFDRSSDIRPRYLNSPHYLTLHRRPDDLTIVTSTKHFPAFERQYAIVLQPEEPVKVLSNIGIGNLWVVYPQGESRQQVSSNMYRALRGASEYTREDGFWFGRELDIVAIEEAILR